MSQLSRFVTVWSALQARVQDGRVPGWAAAVRHRGKTEVRAGGCLSLGGAPAGPDALFRLSSLSKPFAGALTLALVEDGVLDLEDPVARWLPELAASRVLRTRGGPVDDTVPAREPITVRHLLTGTAGFGRLWDDSPLDREVTAAGIGPGPESPDLTPDEYVARWAALPLAAQPGERWLYHCSTDVLSVLLARATGRPLRELLAERVTGPLGLRSTGFSAVDPARLTAAYLPGDGGLQLLDAADGRAARAPRFEGLAAGLVSTAEDVLTFLGALADGGAPVLHPASVATMTTESLTPAQRRSAGDFLPAGTSWGLQVGVDTGGGEPWQAAGRWGWDGGTGTTGWVDPDRDLVAVLLTTRGYGGPGDGTDWFWRAVHRCL
jgi:CubicO group peptidase (beta-lactamase class C family)